MFDNNITIFGHTLTSLLRFESYANTILTLVSIVAMTWALFKFLFLVIKFIHARIVSHNTRYKLLYNDYYSSNFVLSNIKQSSQTIRIVCVRNQRISEPDILEEFKKFLIEKKGRIEIFIMSTKMPKLVLEDSICILPTPPESADEFKIQVDIWNTNLKNMYNELSREEKSRFNVYTYKALPVIHMCQFDNNMYLGLQMFQRDDIHNSLLKYSTKINIDTKVGKELLKQFSYLKDKKSSKYFKD